MSSSKSVPISVRLTQGEADFIARFSAGDAVTPSEKVRSIIRIARERSERPATFGAGLRVAKDLTTPANEATRVAEHAEGIHSELLAQVLDWTPELIALLLSTKL
ncbi:MAG: hypothetical protein O2910_05595, partial [Proteobacteria bacterium]|nr:hypothetical protein [Pseudomonadota bacterium]